LTTTKVKHEWAKWQDDYYKLPLPEFVAALRARTGEAPLDTYEVSAKTVTGGLVITITAVEYDKNGKDIRPKDAKEYTVLETD